MEGGWVGGEGGGQKGGQPLRHRRHKTQDDDAAEEGNKSDGGNVEKQLSGWDNLHNWVVGAEPEVAKDC